jgi:L-fuculose-phosphate aldolase
MGLKAELLYYSRLCYYNGFVKATDGNLSARTKKKYFLATATNTCKGKIRPQDVLKIGLKGNKTEGRRKPSSELKLHLYIYDRRKDVNAVVHTHPKFSTAFASAGFALDKAVLPEVYLKLGKIPLAKYATPSTEEVTQSISELITEHDAILLGNHGLVTMGKTIEEAYFLTEKVEQFAEISFYARMLGGEKELGEAELKKLDLLRKN